MTTCHNICKFNGTQDSLQGFFHLREQDLPLLWILNLTRFTGSKEWLRLLQSLVYSLGIRIYYLLFSMSVRRQHIKKLYSFPFTNDWYYPSFSVGVNNRFISDMLWIFNPICINPFLMICLDLLCLLHYLSGWLASQWKVLLSCSVACEDDCWFY